MNDKAIIRNAHGGEQSAVNGGFHYGFPFEGVMEVSGLVGRASVRYKLNNWRLVTPEEHFAHAVEHLMFAGYQAGEAPDGESRREHIIHAACRLLMLLASTPAGHRFKWQDVPVSSNQMQQIHASLQQQAQPQAPPVQGFQSLGLHPVNAPSNPSPGMMRTSGGWVELGASGIDGKYRPDTLGSQ